MQNSNDDEQLIDFLNEMARQMGLLFKFSRKMNELDFAASLMHESRGSQDPGWSTTITAHQVFEELKDGLSKGCEYSLRETRVLLLLYGQLSEAGGVYEGLKNMMGLVQDKPFLLWPFKDLVRVKKEPKRVIGPNANSTFRNLASHANTIGMPRLADILAQVFRDDIRNAMFHSDYVLWEDGLRLRKRNGGFAERVSYEEVFQAINIGLSFFHTLNTLTSESMKSFDPPREIIGRFSVNPPMLMTVSYETGSGAFSISGSSPGGSTSPEYLRQETLNKLLGGHMLAVFRDNENRAEHEPDFSKYGFAPAEIDMSNSRLSELLVQIEEENLFDDRTKKASAVGLLTLSPWGFRYVSSSADIDDMIGNPDITITFGNR